MSQKRTRQNILTLCIDVLLMVLVSSCNKNIDVNDCGLSRHTEKKEGLIIEFSIPDNYSKDLRDERESSAFFNDKNIISWDASIYFSPDESRSYVSLYVYDLSKEITLSNHHTLDNAGIINTLFLDNMDWDIRLPLVYYDVDNNGNAFYYIMQFTRYSNSDTTWGNIPMIEDNTLPMDSVETDCYYYSIIDNKEVLLEFYMLQSFDDFSFMDVLSMLQSIKVSSK